ncbi:MAG: hypothetical protein M3Y87_32940 [Myxococcota bacterium]|nr:hypothetical protein [Myxococcota bacterium]
MRTRALVVATALLAGCTLVNPPGEHQAPLSPTEFCRAFAELSCQGYLECCPTAVPVPFDDCVVMAANQCTSDFGALAVDSRTGYSEEAAARAAGEGRALADVCSLELADWGVRRTGFQSVLQGTLGGGERCDVPNPPRLGDFAPIFSCESPDLACVAGGSVWQCATRRGPGDPCLLTWDCQDGLYCTGLISGSCQPRQDVGAPCTSNDACASLACRGGFCVPRTATTVYCGMME